MSSQAFPWGRVLQSFSLDFDGKTLEIVKYHPWKSENCAVQVGSPDESTSYSVPEIRQSFDSFDAAVIGWLTYCHLGHNQGALATGICRALGI